MGARRGRAPVNRHPTRHGKRAVAAPISVFGTHREADCTTKAITVQTHPRPVLRSPLRAAPTPPGGTAEFSVEVVTPGEWAFQWLADGKVLPGETNRVLRFAAANANDRRLFSVAVRPRDLDPASPTFRSRPA